MDLRTYLEPIIDGHVGVFNHSSMIVPPKQCIGMMDFQFTEQTNVLESYDKFLPKLKNVLYMNACGLTFDDIKNVHEKYKNVIGGFGELKLYDDYIVDGEKIDVNRKDMVFARQVCEYSSKNNNLPVYIHYDIDCDVAANLFINCVMDYPTVPIVLSHCGMSDVKSECETAFCWCKEWCNIQNLWFDLSWHASQYFESSPELILQLPEKRIIWGSDITPNYIKKKDSGESVLMDPWKIYNNLRPLLTESNNNIRRLYQNSPKFAF